MSWEKRTNSAGAQVYLVRWRDSNGKPRSKTVYRQRDAILMDADIKRKRALGELWIDERQDPQLRDFYVRWCELYAVHLAPRTRQIDDRLWRNHIEPAFGSRKLKAITTNDLIEFMNKLGKRLSASSIVRVMSVLQNILQRAVEWNYLSFNPAAHVRKPTKQPRRGRALTAAELDALCLELDFRSEQFVRVLAHTGLRPGELRALRWEALLPSSSIAVTEAASADAIGPTKTRRTRNVTLRDGARLALRAWFVAQGQPSERDLIFPDKDGSLWSDNAYMMWGHRVFKPAAHRAGLKGIVPYDMRHTFVSTLLAENRDIYWIARQAGHSVRVLSDTYAHIVGGEPVASAGDANLSVLDNLRASRDS